jgi:formate/nitrite transporter FocA (FNT family)
MDYLNPKELVQEAILVARKKASLSVTDMLIRGALSGVFLGFATSLAVIVTSQGLPAIVGAIISRWIRHARVAGAGTRDG